MRVPTPSQRADFDFLQNEGRVWIMGVLNATPDSFYPGSRTPGLPDAVSRAATLIQEGTDLLDIGGESTRPGSTPVSLPVELERVIPLLDILHQRWPDIPFSIDTQKAEVARQAFAHGAGIINDISALRQDPEMAAVIADNDGGVVLMHMQGTPETMQEAPHYASVLDELKAFFEERLAAAVSAGISEEKIILDPGIGFGKTFEHNLTIVKRLSFLKSLGRPLLVGISRKSFIGRLLTSGNDIPPAENRLEGTLAATLWALQEGAQGLRVHDVAATRQAVIAWQALKGPVPA